MKFLRVYNLSLSLPLSLFLPLFLLSPSVCLSLFLSLSLSLLAWFWKVLLHVIITESKGANWYHISSFLHIHVQIWYIIDIRVCLCHIHIRSRLVTEYVHGIIKKLYLNKTFIFHNRFSFQTIPPPLEIFIIGVYIHVYMMQNQQLYANLTLLYLGVCYSDWMNKQIWMERCTINIKHACRM